MIDSTTSHANSFKTQKVFSQSIETDYIINPNVNEDNRLSLPLPSPLLNNKGNANNNSNKYLQWATTSNGFNASNDIFKKVSCKNKQHNQLYLSFDVKKMCIVCLKCKENGKTGYQLEVIQTKSIDNNSNLNENAINTDSSNDKSLLPKQNCLTKNCNGHPCFFCENCLGAICYKCMLNLHLSHQTNSMQYISNSFKDYLNEMANALKAKIDECTNELFNSKTTDDSKKSISLKLIDQLSSLIDSANENVNSSLASIKEAYYKKFCEAYQSNDKLANEIDSSITKLNPRYSNSEKFLINIMRAYDNGSIENILKCEMKQKAKGDIETIQALINEAEEVLSKLHQLNEYTQKNKDTISVAQQNTLKHLFELEDSLLFSIKRGSIDNMVMMDRFNSFKPNTMMYFKSSSIELMPTSNEVDLIGVSVCGLFINESKLGNPNNQMHQMENRDGIEVNITLSIVNNDIGKGSDDPQVVIKETKKLYGIVNANDPMVLLYFSNKVLLQKNRSYVITINNLNGSNYYGDFWTGSTPLDTIVTMSQSIKCNTTGVNMMFKSVKDTNKEIQSDFDEFSIGIIGGIIYS